MLAAVLVLYNPDFKLLENIKSYIPYVKILYVIDNSDLSSNESLFEDFTFSNKLKYVYNGDNLGIAKAINIGCQMAINDGFTWTLTMDQDSKFLNFNNQVIDYIFSNKNRRIALYYPKYLVESVEYDKGCKEDNKLIAVMSSGNIINLNIYSEINGFENKLFIDFVDIDYCLKLKKEGYQIVKMPNVILSHELGQTERKSFLWFNPIVTNHSSIRRYYITRNRLYTMNKYKKVSSVFYNMEFRSFFNDIFKIILFENQKLSKFISVFKGIFDYKRNKYGKI